MRSLPFWDRIVANYNKQDIILRRLAARKHYSHAQMTRASSTGSTEAHEMGMRTAGPRNLPEVLRMKNAVADVVEPGPLVSKAFIRAYQQVC